jgi:hypothetical protein
MWDIYFWVDDVDAIYEELRERGAIIDYHLGVKPYGVKEFGVQDVDDHDIGFGQVLDLGDLRLSWSLLRRRCRRGLEEVFYGSA